MGTDAGTPRIADELEIRSVLARLAQTADVGDAADYAALFTEDAVWDMPGNPLTGITQSTIRGRDAILAGAKERRAAGLQGPGTNTRHLLTTIAVNIETDRDATADLYFLFLADTAAAPAVRGVGAYHDVFRKTSDGWKLAHRTITMG
jgi:uncharacterized protein (TIGR02246 family)